MTTVKFENAAIENFLHEQTIVNKISTVDYLTSLIMNEMEYLEAKQDMKILESEIKQVNNGLLKPKPAHLLLDES